MEQVDVTRGRTTGIVSPDARFAKSLFGGGAREVAERRPNAR
jgi:hypothetical protein